VAATHAVVCLPSLDVRRRPDHRSEMTSQFLMGEIVRLAGRERGGWVPAEGEADGYRGWVRSWGLVPATRSRAGRWRRLARARVNVAWTEVRATPRGASLVSPLPWNARVIAGRARRGWRAVELPDGRRGVVPAAALAGPNQAPPGLIERVRGLLGVTYLWGGRTPAGFDCSGFTQQLYAERGVALPRDASDQFRSCRALAGGEAEREGDLVFFRAAGRRVGHVGVVLGGGYFAHVRGRVRIASLERSNPLWDMELARQFAGFGRPPVRPLRGARR